jgi:hypothetical protein
LPVACRHSVFVNAFIAESKASGTNCAGAAMDGTRCANARTPCSGTWQITGSSNPAVDPRREKEPVTSFVHGTDSTSLRFDTIGHALDAAAARWGQREALVVRHQGIRWTYDGSRIS